MKTETKATNEQTWWVGEAPDRTLFINEGKFHIAKVCGSTAVGTQRGVFLKRADLLAAAPDLLSVAVASLAVARNLRQTLEGIKAETTLEKEGRAALLKLANDFTRQAEAAIKQAGGR